MGVGFPNELLQKNTPGEEDGLFEAPTGDPRAAHPKDPGTTYSVDNARFPFLFQEKKKVLTVCEASAMPKDKK